MSCTNTVLVFMSKFSFFMFYDPMDLLINLGVAHIFAPSPTTIIVRGQVVWEDFLIQARIGSFDSITHHSGHDLTTYQLLRPSIVVYVSNFPKCICRCQRGITEVVWVVVVATAGTAIITYADDGFSPPRSN